MYKFPIIFIFIIFLIPKSIFAEDISVYEIEGISIGDNLLDFLSKDEVLKSIKITKNHYSNLREPNKYAEIYYRKNLKKYDFVSIFIKFPISNIFLSKKNEKFTVLTIRGGINFINDMEGCLNQRNKLIRNFRNHLVNARQKSQVNKHPLDPSGKSFYDIIAFKFKNGDSLELSCNDWEETFRNKRKFSEGFNLALFTKDVSEWMSN